MSYKFNNLYLAYGSNLNREDWDNFCKRFAYSTENLQFEDVVRIPDYQLVFDWFSKGRNGGVANIKYAVGHYLDAVLFSTDDEGLRSLRHKEGHPHSYVENEVIALKSDGSEITAKVYIVPPERSLGYVKPSENYYKICKAGYQSYNLSFQNLTKAANGENIEPLSALFSYGTLMRGEARHALIADYCKIKGNVSFALTGTVNGKLTTNSSFPGLDQSRLGVTYGDLMKFNNILDVLKCADKIEGFKKFGDKDNFFRRTITTVSTGGFEQDLGWVYVFDGSLGSEIVSNDWRIHKKKKLSFYYGLLETYGQFDPTFEERLPHILEKSRDDRDKYLTEGFSEFGDIEHMLISEKLHERDIANAARIWCAWPKESHFTYSGRVHYEQEFFSKMSCDQ